MRKYDEILDNLDPFVLDYPKYIQELIQHRKEAIVEERQ